MPLQRYSHPNTTSIAVYDTGIVFYIYSEDFCKSANRYYDQIKKNTEFIKSVDPKVLY